MKAGVLTVSDGISRGERADRSGPYLATALQDAGHSVVHTAVVPDNQSVIETTLRNWCDAGCDVIITTGGTGFAATDVTPEATAAVADREAPGIAEMLRFAAYPRMNRSVLSRGRAVLRGNSLIVNLAGSLGAAHDGITMLLPLIPHAVSMLRDEPLDHTPKPEPPGEPAAPALVVVLEANIDDMPAELFEPLADSLFAAGALDVFATPIQMKKSRPATLVTAIVAMDAEDAVADAFFEQSTTFGVRRTVASRRVLARRTETVSTRYGSIRVKVGEWKGRDVTASPEYADVAAAAAVSKAPAKEVYAAALAAWAAR